MKIYRIIARMDIKGPNLVKGIHLEGLRVLGLPDQFAEYYYKHGADELFYQDVVASLYERNSLTDLISKTARRSFIPLTVGGGIRTVNDIKDILRAGADKVCINTAAIKSPSLISEAARKFGSSTIVAAIEAIRESDGSYYAFIDNGREQTGMEAVAWAKKVTELGAGEIVITSVDRDGTGQGFDIDLTQSIAQAVNVPVIAHGGAGILSHIRDVISIGHADAVAVASMIHYDCIVNEKAVKDFKTTEGNLTFLKSQKTSFGKIDASSIMRIKNYLTDNKIKCRI